MRFALLSLGAGLVATCACTFLACAETDDPPLQQDTPDAQTVPRADGETDAPASGCKNDVCPPSLDCTTTDFCSMEYPLPRVVALTAIWGSGPSDIWAVGARGSILHGDGTKFVPAAPPSSDIYVAVWGTGSKDVWVLGPSYPSRSDGWNGTSARFEPQRGASWDPANENTGRIWSGQSTGSRVWLAGEASRRFGASASFWTLALGADATSPAWTRAAACTATQPCTPIVRALWAADADTAWAVGRDGQSFVFDGKSADPRFVLLDSTTRDDLEAVWGSSANDVWAVGHGGTIRHTTKGAATWTETPSGTTNDLYAVWGSGPSDVWAVGEHGTIVHYNGQVWTPANFGLPEGDEPTRLLGIWGSGPDDVWIVGEGLLLHRSATSRRQP